MKKVDKHILFERELHDRIQKVADEKSYTYKKAVHILLERALDIDDIMIAINQINNNVARIAKATNFNTSLLKQIYSDFEFENITDINKSKALNQFYKKRNANKFND